MNVGRNICINMRLSREDLERLEEEKARIEATTSTVISAAIERGYEIELKKKRR